MSGTDPGPDNIKTVSDTFTWTGTLGELFSLGADNKLYEMVSAGVVCIAEWEAAGQASATGSVESITLHF